VTYQLLGDPRFWLRSVGSVQPWSGDISDKDGLMAAVDARSFAHGSGEQRELILILGEHAVCLPPLVMQSTESYCAVRWARPAE